jgi:hypothetical protein
LLRPLIRRVRAHDRSLAEQIRRAASSVVLNLGEVAYSDPGNQRARLFTACGSANDPDCSQDGGGLGLHR